MNSSVCNFEDLVNIMNSMQDLKGQQSHGIANQKLTGAAIAAIWLSFVPGLMLQGSQSSAKI